MEQLPETAISIILSNSNTKTLNSLSRISQSLTSTISKVSESNYQMKLMTVAYLNIDPIELSGDNTNNNWEEVYKFVTLIGDKTYLLYTRDVLHAKLGILIGAELKLPIIMKQATADTIAYLLTLSFLDDMWNSNCIDDALEYRRQDVCLMLLEDGKSLTDTDMTNIDHIIRTSIMEGCGDVFMYIMQKYPQYSLRDLHIHGFVFDNIGYYYLISLCYGLTSVGNKLAKTELVDKKSFRLAQAILRYRDHGIMDNELRELDSINVIEALIKSGNIDRAYNLLGNTDLNLTQFYTECYAEASDLYGESEAASMTDEDCEEFVDKAVEDFLIEAIIIGLVSNSEKRNYSRLPSYISEGYIKAVSLLNKLVCLYDIDLALIQLLSTLVSDDDRDNLIKKALKYGNWKYAIVMSSI
jgi:hypothetical protein